MKKLLALILALVMVMGLATVGTNAALVEYTDADDITEYFDEAIDVMSAIGVLEGADGQFRPTVVLKRSEAAKIVAYLNTNNRTAEGLVGVGKFSDVPTNHWAAGYIDYLSSINVLAGRSETTFDPDGDLTAIDFAKMLLVVVGYDPQIEGLVGSDYQINTSKLAVNAGLFNGLKDVKPTDKLNREQAAQMAFNTIKAATVEYSNKGGNVSINGADIAFGASNAEYVVTDLAKEQRISTRQLTNAGNGTTKYTVEFGERQYPDLRLDPDNDDFGRPVNVWTYAKDDIGTYIDQDTVVGSFTTAVTGEMLVNLIGDAKIRNTDKDKFNYYVNGELIEYQPLRIIDEDTRVEVNNPFYSKNDTITYGTDATQQKNLLAVGKDNMIRSNKSPYGFTGNGVLTEVFEREENGTNVFYITSTMTYYVKADGDYNASTGKIAYDVFTTDPITGTVGNDGTGLTNSKAGDPVGVVAPEFVSTFKDNQRISAEDFPEIATLKDGDGFLVRFYWDKDDSKFGVGEITLDPEVKKEQTITKYSTGKSGRSNGSTINDTSVYAFYTGYVVSGSQYDYSKAAFLDPYLRYYSDVTKALKPTYDLVFDEYGYLIAAFQNEEEDHYLFLTGIDMSTSNLAAGTARGFVIFGDGSARTVTVDYSETNKNLGYEAGGPASPYGTKTAVYNGAKAGNYRVMYDMIDKTTGHAYNRWFTYTTSGEGSGAVYTLYPVTRSQIIGVDNFASDGTPENAMNTNGTKHVFSASQTKLVGNYINDWDSTTKSGNVSVYTVDETAFNQTTAWLNENSTMITVKVGKTSAGTNAKAYEDYGIASVSGVYTGIQNTNIQSYDTKTTNVPTNGDYATSNPFNAVAWTVYDSNRYVKYAIIMGSDAGASNSYLYATSGATHERYEEDGYYYWEFNGILDGEEKVLTLKSKYQNKKTALDTAGITTNDDSGTKDNALFKATFDKDGNVTELLPISWANEQTGDYSNVYNNFQKGNSYRLNSDFTVYNTYFAAGDTLYVSGDTLYNMFNYTPSNDVGIADYGEYELRSDIGLAVLPNAPIFVIQNYRSLSTGATSKQVVKYDSLAKALGGLWGYDVDANGLPTTPDANNGGNPLMNQVNSRTRVGGFSGFVAAALDQGQRAKWVVIKNIGSTVNVVDRKDQVGNGTGNNQTTGLYTLDQVMELEYYKTNSDVETGDSYKIRADIGTLTKAITLSMYGVAGDGAAADDYMDAYFTTTDITLSIYEKCDDGKYKAVETSVSLKNLCAAVASSAHLGSNSTDQVKMIQIAPTALSLPKGTYRLIIHANAAGGPVTFWAINDLVIS